MINNRYKILIIEDEEHINNLISALMEANGYQAVSAYSCRGGQMMFASHHSGSGIAGSGWNDIFKGSAAIIIYTDHRFIGTF